MPLRRPQLATMWSGSAHPILTSSPDIPFFRLLKQRSKLLTRSSVSTSRVVTAFTRGRLRRTSGWCAGTNGLVRPELAATSGAFWSYTFKILVGAGSGKMVKIADHVRPVEP